MFARRIVALTAMVAVLALSACAPGTAPEMSASSSPGVPPTSTGSSATTTPGGPSDAPTAAITIEHPAEGETVSVPFIATGTADTFEATLTIDAVDAEGLAVCVRHLTATSGSGTRGTWQGVLAFAPDEDALAVTMRAYALSAKDGSIVDLVEVPLIISPDRPKIVLTSPRCGDAYDAGGLMLVTGTAALFEAAFTVELRDGRGTIMALPVTADECCVASNFSTRITLPGDLPGGFYDVAAYSLSAKDGTVENEFVVQIEVRA